LSVADKGADRAADKANLSRLNKQAEYNQSLASMFTETWIEPLLPTQKQRTFSWNLTLRQYFVLTGIQNLFRPDEFVKKMTKVYPNPFLSKLTHNNILPWKK
jgi:hypothetical protein